MRGERLEQVADPEIAKSAAEQHRCQVSFKKRGRVERPAGGFCKCDLFDRRLGDIGRQQFGNGGRFGRRCDRNCLFAINAPNGAVSDVVDACKRTAGPQRPGQRCGVEGQRFLDFLKECERLLALPVELVDEGDDRDVAQSADLEELLRSRLDAARRVDHHHRRVDR